MEAIVFILIAILVISLLEGSLIFSFICAIGYLTQEISIIYVKKGE